MKHTLIIIGWMGSKKCYLDMSKEEAITRYNKNDNFEQFQTPLESIEFDDEFSVYDIWE